jgi:hypothetical protein
MRDTTLLVMALGNDPECWDATAIRKRLHGARPVNPIRRGGKVDHRSAGLLALIAVQGLCRLIGVSPDCQGI